MKSVTKALAASNDYSLKNTGFVKVRVHIGG